MEQNLDMETENINAETPEEAPKEPEKSVFQAIVSDLFDWLETFCLALCALILTFVFVVRYVSVDGDSMNNTLAHGDKLIISDINYTPQTGDIVVVYVESRREPYIKRVIAAEGQHVKINFETWEIFVDGILLDESQYVNRTEGDMKRFDCPEEFTVPEGMIFIMGDNRNNSRDSRDFASVGFIKEHSIVGKVLFRVYPQWGKVN